MEKFIIKGGKKLSGEVIVSGSKNATLPIICASLLTKEKITLQNVPNIADVHTMIEIIESLGAKTSFENKILEIDPSDLSPQQLPDRLIDK
ncbi:MAG: UDP-N-acetylglucosamine 1-carboxyvinyltransferase, partial [Nitrospirae bacterium]|nr:UDP-N-acetylglucosamine 1-carboxyvinyltransferase [Nitrospirota bacterium]